MKKFRTVLLAFCMAGLMAGCGSTADVETTSVIIDKKGAITQVIVEDFNQPYYNADELKGEIEQKAGQYNTSSGNEKAIVLDSLSVSDQGVVKVKLEFAGWQDYTGFNEKLLFVGTVSEAYSAGYTFPDMTIAADGSRLDSADVLEKGDMHIAIMEETQSIRVPAKIAYYSEGASLSDEKTAVNLNEGQTAFIIYE